MFFVFSQVTGICIGEKGETQAGSEPKSLAIGASIIQVVEIVSAKATSFGSLTG
jgi:hypothetical protein